MNFIRYSLTILVVAFAVETHCQSANSLAGVLVNNVIACEDERVTLQCSNAGKSIVILTADYGRTEPGESFCPNHNIHTLTCTSILASTQIASQQCGGKRACELYAKNTVFGDPCSGTHKYLSVKFICI